MRKRSSWILFANWTPIESGLKGYYNALDMQTAVTIPGVQQNFVPRLGDDSGNGRDLNSINNAQSPNFDTTTQGIIFPESKSALLVDTATGAADYWKFLHDGTGCTIAFNAFPTGTTAKNLAVSSTNSATGTGTNIWHDGVAQKWVAEVRNATVQILQLTATGTFPINQRYSVIFTFVGNTGQLWVNGILVATGTISNPVNTAAVNGLALGRFQGANLSWFKGSILAWLFYNRVLADYEIVSTSNNLRNVKSPRPIRRLWVGGDSLTSQALWQNQVWIRHLASTEMQIDFIGTRLAGEISLFVDRQNNALSGFSINGLKTDTNGIVFTDGEPTDILFMIGTNNTGQDFNTVMSQYDSLVQQYMTQHPVPKSRMWLMRPPRRIDSVPAHDWIEAYSVLVENYANTNDYQFIDSDVNSDAEMDPDGIHLTTAGQTTIGNKVADALGL